MFFSVGMCLHVSLGGWVKKRDVCLRILETEKKLITPSLVPFVQRAVLLHSPGAQQTVQNPVCGSPMLSRKLKLIPTLKSLFAWQASGIFTQYSWFHKASVCSLPKPPKSVYHKYENGVLQTVHITKQHLCDSATNISTKIKHHHFYITKSAYICMTFFLLLLQVMGRSLVQSTKALTSPSLWLSKSSRSLYTFRTNVTLHPLPFSQGQDPKGICNQTCNSFFDQLNYGFHGALDKK